MNISKIYIRKSWLIKGGLSIIALLVIGYWSADLVEFFALVGDREVIIEYLNQYGPLGPVVLFVILTLQVFFAILPGHAFIIAGGYVFGLLVGAAITQISTVTASQLAFLLTRRWGRPLVDRMAPEHVVDHWNRLAEKQGGLFFFFSFVLPIFPNDLMSFVAGLSSISPRKFFVANFFGRLPCAIFVTLIGSHGFELPLWFWIGILLLLLGVSILWKQFSTRFERQFLTEMAPVKCVRG